MFRSIVTLLKKLALGNEREVLLALRQPLTAKQLAQRLDIRATSSAAALERLNEIGLVRCLNPFARASRLYWHTRIGEAFSTEPANQPLPSVPKLDWSLYGSLCFSHRATVLKTLTRPMSPGMIRRQARFNDPALRMNTNNIRDVLRYCEQKRLVERVYQRKKAHPLYQVTKAGQPYQTLLCQAEVVE